MRLTLLPLMIFIDSSSTSRALSTHRSRFVPRVSSQNGALPSPSAPPFSSLGHRRRRGTTNDSRKLFLGSDSHDQHQDEEQQQPIPTTIGKTEMTEILAHVENRTGDENYVVMDVRGADEIMMGTGLMSSDVKNLPLPQITSMGAFDMGEASFEAQFNFPKPKIEDTLVFTCQAGPRSQQAAQLAAVSGYKTIIVYEGGADDWFGGEFVYS